MSEIEKHLQQDSQPTKRILTAQLSERIEETKRRLGSKLVLESLEAGGGRSLLGRSESSGGGDKGGENGGLHGVRFDYFLLQNCEGNDASIGFEKRKTLDRPSTRGILQDRGNLLQSSDDGERSPRFLQSHQRESSDAGIAPSARFFHATFAT